MEELIAQLNTKVDQLTDLFFKHKHLGTDKSQKLTSSGSFAKGQASLSSGHVNITDSQCKTTSKVMALHNTGVSPTKTGEIATVCNTGNFDIYSWTIGGGGTVETSDNGLIDYVIFY